MIVSVIIATYNSSRFIVETLDSVYNQSYKDIELIVSDDCSTDNTRQVTDRWITTHKDRFIKVVHVKTSKNLGISGNYNNALNYATGEWVKTLDSDDLLLPNCITDSLKVAMSNSSICIWFFGWENIEQDGSLINREPNQFPNSNVRQQFRHYLIYRPNLHSNTLFVKKDTLMSVGAFDERYPMTQDIPLVYKLLSKRHQFGIAPDTYTIQFRNVPSSVSRSGNKKMTHDIAECRWYYSRYYLKYGLFFHWYNAQVVHFLDKYSDRNIFFKSIGYIFRFFDVKNFVDRRKGLRVL